MGVGGWRGGGEAAGILRVWEREEARLVPPPSPSAGLHLLRVPPDIQHSAAAGYAHPAPASGTCTRR